MKRLNIRVTGRVQGVSYRASTQRKALELGLKGWVRNLPDGSVEVAAEGTDAALALLVAWCRQGPPMAQVADVAVAERLPEGFASFEVRY